MRKKIASAAILAAALALPVSGALAGHGGGGGGGGHGGGMSASSMGGGRMGGSAVGGRMGTVSSAGRMTTGLSPRARTTFAAAPTFGLHGVRSFRHRHRNFFFVNGFGYSGAYCWDWVATPYGWRCRWPYDYYY